MWFYAIDQEGYWFFVEKWSDRLLDSGDWELELEGVEVGDYWFYEAVPLEGKVWKYIQGDILRDVANCSAAPGILLSLLFGN